MKKLVLFLLSLSVAIASAVSASAQITTSAMEGTVSDDSGEALAGAVVTAIHTPTGSQYYAVANDKGHWAISGMRTGGPYEVAVSFLGMGELKYEGITLKLGDPYVIDAVMKASNELDAVVVVSESAFNASKTGAGASFGLQQVESIPNISRSVLDVVKYTPQAVASKQGGISIGGASSRYNSFQIDGAVANDSFGLSSDGTNGSNVGANPISMDAVEEIQVVVAPFDVRQSGFTGGGINAITKSGTNKVKGTFYSHYYNQDFIGTTAGPTDLSNPLALSSALETLYDADGNKTGFGARQKYENQYNMIVGATVGAPIIKNKLFAFVSVEYSDNVRTNIYSPRNGSYDTSATATDDRRLKSPVTLADGSVHNYLDPDLAQAVIDKYISLYSNGGKDIKGNPVVEGFEPQQLNTKSINFLTRLDWNINDSNHFMFRYQLLNANKERRDQGYKTYYFNNSNFDHVNSTHTLVGELNSRISDNIHNELRATAVLTDESRHVPYVLPTIYTNGDNTIVDIGTGYCSYINKVLVNTYTLEDNLSVALGDHRLTFGTHNELYSFANAYRTYATGQYEFSTIADFMEQAPGHITASQFKYNYADPTVDGVDGPDWFAVTKALQLGFYAQDEWKPSREFSLTYGLRGDVPMLLNKPSVNEGYNAAAGTYSTDASEQVGIVPGAKLLLSPRVGFRLFLNEDHSTLLRGGAGIFTGRVPFVWLSNAYNNTGVETKSVAITDSNMLELLPITTDPYNDIVLGDKFTYYTSDATGNTVAAANALAADGSVKPGYTAHKGVQGSGAGATINTLNKNFKYPQVFRVNLGLDQEFANGWKLTFDAIFSKSFNNIYFKNIALEEKGRFLPVGAASPSASTAYYQPKTADYKTIIALTNTNKGYAYSASIKAEKHFDFGLDVMASYTYGHSYSCNDGLSSQAASNLSTLKAVDINNPELAYSLYDTPHKVNAVLSYTSPIYGGRFRTHATLAYTGTSGQRYSYIYYDTTSSDVNGDGTAQNTLMYIPTESEIMQMSWSKATDALLVEEAIAEDPYLASHRGQWSERNAAISPFEHHFDLQLAEDIFYDTASKRKVQITFDLVNASNLLNREWGLYYSSSIYKSILTVDSISKDSAGNWTPKYSYKADHGFSLTDFNSRWRCQLGVKFTF